MFNLGIVLGALKIQMFDVTYCFETKQKNSPKTQRPENIEEND